MNIDAGSSVSVSKGTAVLNFGAIPGTNIVTMTVTGQTSIVSGSNVEAFIMACGRVARRCMGRWHMV